MRTEPINVRRGFNVKRCPMCGNENPVIYLALDDTRVFKCDQDCDFEEKDVRELIDEWAKILDWLQTAPQLAEEGKGK